MRTLLQPRRSPPSISIRTKSGRVHRHLVNIGVGEAPPAHAPVSSAWFRIIYPDTIRDAGSDLLTAVKGTTISIDNCTEMPADVRKVWLAWSTSVATWLQSAIDDPGWFGLGSLMDQIETYAHELRVWQDNANTYCTNIVSPLVDPAQISAREDWWKTMLQWAVVGTVAVAGAYGVAKVVEIVEVAIAHRESEPKRLAASER